MNLSSVVSEQPVGARLATNRLVRMPSAGLAKNERLSLRDLIHQGVAIHNKLGRDCFVGINPSYQ